MIWRGQNHKQVCNRYSRAVATSQIFTNRSYTVLIGGFRCPLPYVCSMRNDIDARYIELRRHSLTLVNERQTMIILYKQFSFNHSLSLNSGPRASYQIRKIAGCACAGNAGNVFPPPRVSDLDMHHGTIVTHVSWCISGSLTNGFLWNRWRGKRSRHSRRTRNPQFYVSGKRPIVTRHFTNHKKTGWNIAKTWKSRKTHHTSPSWARYGLSFSRCSEQSYR